MANLLAMNIARFVSRNPCLKEAKSFTLKRKLIAMLKPNPAGQFIKLLSALILLVCLLLPNFSQAQQTSPLNGKPKNKTIIALDFDEYGKILNNPAGFSLVEGGEYAFQIKVAAPKKQHAVLKKYFRESLVSLKEKLEDPTNNETQLCSLLLGSDIKLKNYIQELESLITIIDKDDAAAISDLTSKAANGDFVYLPKAQVISESLYGTTFTVIANGKPVTAKYDQDISISVPAATYPVNQTSLIVQIEDLKKRFVADYFNKTYVDIQADIDALKPGVFYQKEVENGIDKLVSWRQELIYRLEKLDTTNLSVLCDYPLFKGQYSGNEFITFLEAYPKWFLSWAWYTGGNIRLNPLDFTEMSRLRFQEGYDTVKAQKMDKYVKVSMKRMADLKSDLKISVAEYDSLNRQLDKVEDLYSYAAANEELKKKNKQALTKIQQIKRTIDSLSFRVVPNDDKRIYFIKSYDAANYLQPADKSKIQALPISKEVEIMVYNVKSTQSVSVTPAFKDTPDQSLAMEQLSKVGDLGTSLMEQALKAAPTLAGLRSKPVGLVRVELPPIHEEILNKDVVRKTHSLASFEKIVVKRQYTMKLILNSKPLKMSLIFTDEKATDEFDLWAEVKETLKKKNIYCTEVIDSVAQELLSGLRPDSAKMIGSFAQYESYRDTKLEEYRARIIKLTEKAIEDYTNMVYINLSNDFSLLTLAHAMLESKAYILPPKAIKVQDDPSAPAYSNIYESVAVQESSKMVTIPLVLSNKADSKVIAKRTDTYKVSQPHWIMASLGLSYAFGEFRRNEIEVKEGKIVNSPDEEQQRLVAGFHIYPFPILLTDNRFIVGMKRDWKSRLSIFLGASFPKPLYNPKIGISVDPWPGVKVTSGLHFYRKTFQTILNDQIQDEDSKYVYNAPFMSLSIEPVSFVKLIGLIK